MEESAFRQISDQRLAQVEFWKRKCAENQAVTAAEALRAAGHLLQHYCPAARDEATRREWLEAREALQRLGIADDCAAQLERVESRVWQEQPVAVPADHLPRTVAKLEEAVGAVEALARACEAARPLEKLSAVAERLERLHARQAAEGARLAALLDRKRPAERLLAVHLAQLQAFNELLLAQLGVQRETLAALLCAQSPAVCASLRAELTQLKRGCPLAPAQLAVQEELEAAHRRLVQLERDKRELLCLGGKLKAGNDRLVAEALAAA